MAGRTATGKKAWEDAPGKGRKKKKTNSRNTFSMVVITISVLVLSGLVFMNSISLQKKIDGYSQRIAELEEEIAKEEKRAEEIEELRVYTQTKGYAEEMARQILELVREGEILFKQE